MKHKKEKKDYILYHNTRCSKSRACHKIIQKKGISFNEMDFQELPKLLELLEHLWNDGIEAICPTFISCSVSSLHLLWLFFVSLFVSAFVCLLLF